MTQDKDPQVDAREEGEIDLLELFTKLWNNRRFCIKWCCIAAVVGLVIAFSIPKVYTTEVRLAPESGESGTGGLGSLASMAGINLGSDSGEDALYPELYPEVVSSIPFITNLFDTKVRTEEDEPEITFVKYLKDDTRSAWWSYIFALPGKVMGIFRSKDKESANHELNTFHLTKQESKLVESLRSMISTTVDNKTNIITIKVTTQNPLVSAMLADTVVTHLQQYLTDYRTNKARQDLEYTEKLNEEAKAAYYEAQQRYAEFLDRNQGLIRHSSQTVSERLQNEAQLAFNLYNSTAQKVQLARAKVQEKTPAYTIITPASVPLLASAPRKMFILVGFVFVGFIGSAAWILFLAPTVQEFKKKRAEDPKSTASGKGA